MYVVAKRLDGSRWHLVCPQRGTTAPTFRPMSILAKRLGGSRCHFVRRKKVGIGPGHVVLDGDPAPFPKGAQHSSNFRPVSIVAIRSPISATAEHLLKLVVHILAGCSSIYPMYTEVISHGENASFYHVLCHQKTFRASLRLTMYFTLKRIKAMHAVLTSIETTRQHHGHREYSCFAR